MRIKIRGTKQHLSDRRLIPPTCGAFRNRHASPTIFSNFAAGRTSISGGVCSPACRLLRRKPMSQVTRFGNHVRLELHPMDSRVATVVLDRPERRNAVNRPIADALRAAFEMFDADPSMAVAVLWGAGGTFCAGADLTALNDDEHRNEIHADGTGPGPMGPPRLMRGKPVIAAIAGHAVAGGLELAAWCDLRIVEEDAVLGVFCRRFGVPLIDGGTVRLPRMIGLSRALALILTGRAV